MRRPRVRSGNTTYTPGTPVLDTVQNGPWTLSQGDPAAGAPYGESTPTFTPGGTPDQSGGFPNLAVYPDADSPTGTPYASGVAGTPGPVSAYCTGGGGAPESGTQAAEPVDAVLPMSPYYFPFVTQTPGDSAAGHLTGYFDYRPKDTEEEVVVARSTDAGQSWSVVGKVLEQNPEGYCPTGDSNDNGEGHSFVMTVGTNSYLYTVNRGAGDNVGVGLLVHAVNPSAANPLAELCPTVEPVGTDPDTFAQAARLGRRPPAAAAPPSPSPRWAPAAEQVGGGAVRGPRRPVPLRGRSSPAPAAGGESRSRAARRPTALACPVAAETRSCQVARRCHAPPTTIPQGPNTPAETGGVTLCASTPTSAPPPRPTCRAASTSTGPPSTASTATARPSSTTAPRPRRRRSVSMGDAVTTDPILPSDTGQAEGASQTTASSHPTGSSAPMPSSICLLRAPRRGQRRHHLRREDPQLLHRRDRRQRGVAPRATITLDVSDRRLQPPSPPRDRSRSTWERRAGSRP